MEKPKQHLNGDKITSASDNYRLKLHVHVRDEKENGGKTNDYGPQFLVIMTRTETICQLKIEIKRVYEAIYNKKCPKVSIVKDSQQSIVLETYRVGDAFADNEHIVAVFRDRALKSEGEMKKKKKEKSKHKRINVEKTDESFLTGYGMLDREEEDWEYTCDNNVSSWKKNEIENMQKENIPMRSPPNGMKEIAVPLDNGQTNHKSNFTHSNIIESIESKLVQATSDRKLSNSGNLLDQKAKKLREKRDHKTSSRKAVEQVSTNHMNSHISTHDDENWMTNTPSVLSDCQSDDNLSSQGDVSRRSSQSTPLVSLKDLRLDLPKKKRHALSDDEKKTTPIPPKKQPSSCLKLEKVTDNLPLSSSSSSSDESDSDDDFSSPASNALSALVSDAKSINNQTSDSKSLKPLSTKMIENFSRMPELVSNSPRLSFHQHPEKNCEPYTQPNRSTLGSLGMNLGMNETGHKQTPLTKRSLFPLNMGPSPIHRPLSEMELDVLSHGTEKIEELLNDESWWQVELHSGK